MISKLPALMEEFQSLQKQSSKYSSLADTLAYSITQSTRDAHLLQAGGLNAARDVVKQCYITKTITDEENDYLSKLIKVCFAILGLRRQITENTEATWNMLLRL